MKCFSAAATVVLAAMLCGCQQKADMTPVWQTDLPTTGVHMELSNTDDISFDPAYYAQTREDAFYNNLHEISAVMAEGAPVVTFYGVTADEVKLIYLENIGDYLYVALRPRGTAGKAGLRAHRRRRLCLLQAGHRV